MRTTRGEPLWCLCCNCGVVTLERTWTYWQARDDWKDEADKWRPSENGETDAMAVCPRCKCEHRDGDYSPGYYLGTITEMYAERAQIVDDYAEDWALVEATS